MLYIFDHMKSESIDLFIEDQVFSPSYNSAPPPPPSVSNLYRRHTGRLGDRGWGRRQIIRRQESLVLYKSFNALRMQYSVNGAILFPWFFRTLPGKGEQRELAKIGFLQHSQLRLRGESGTGCTSILAFHAFTWRVSQWLICITVTTKQLINRPDSDQWCIRHKFELWPRRENRLRWMDVVFIGQKVYR